MFQDQILREVEQRLGHSLYDYQRQAILTLMDDRDLVVSAPTGHGKTAIYQGAAIVFRDEGCTLVVSPLVALLRDQARRAEALHLDYAMVYGETRGGERSSELAKIHSRQADLVFATPESLQQSNRLRKALQNRGVALMVIDEAHAFEDWALSFRSVYRRLGSIARSLGARRWLLCSATITAETALRAIETTKRQHWSAMALPATRPNLHYKSIFLPEPEKAVAQAFSGKGDRFCAPGIVFVATVKGVHTLLQRASDLLGWAHGDPRLLRYHGKGMPKGDQRRNQKEWMENSRWIVATNAFGMGIDKANVRNVLHVTLPASLTAYAQEAGRAGRDGLDADCWLNAAEDGHSSEWLTMQNYPSYEVIRAIWEFYRNQPGDWIESQPARVTSEIDVGAAEYQASIGWLQGKKQLLMRARSKDYRVRFAPDASERCGALPNPEKKRALVVGLEAASRWIGEEQCFLANREDLDDKLGPVYRSWSSQLDIMHEAGCFSLFTKPSRGGWVKCAFPDFQFDSSELDWARERAKERLEAMRAFSRMPEADRAGAIARAIGLEVDDLTDRIGRLYGAQSSVEQVTVDPIVAGAQLSLDQDGGVEL